MLSGVEMNLVFDHYQLRLAAHQELVQYLKTDNVCAYTDLALGIARPEGNYSASEYNLGPQVLYNNSKESVFNFAKLIIALQGANMVPDAIYHANMPYLRISIGSEMAMMLDPDKYWVGNVRTIYSHLLLKHGGDRVKADEELRLYREPDGRRPSEMEYKIWKVLYPSMESSLKQIANMGNEKAQKNGIPVGEHVYMWADAISSYVYSNHA